MKTGIIITKAEYVKDYIIKLIFSDGKVNFVDFEQSVKYLPQYKKYLKPENFKKFYLTEFGDLVWGKDWDLVFPIHRLYYNNLDAKPGRKPVADKKVLIRLYVRQSVIDRFGGLAETQNLCYKTLQNVL